MMKKIIVFAMLLTSLGSFAQNAVDSIPDWFNKPPVSSKKYFGVGLGVSRSMEIAEQKAILQGKVSIAEQVKPAKVKEIRKSSTSKNSKTNEEIIQQKIINAELNDVRIIKKSSFQKGDEYTVYVLLEMKKK